MEIRALRAMLAELLKLPLAAGFKAVF